MSDILRKVDAGPSHSLPTHKMTDAERGDADIAVSAGHLRKIPAGHGVSVQGGRYVTAPVKQNAHRYPERYSVTSGGSHHLRTFDQTKDVRRGESIQYANPYLESIIESLRNDPENLRESMQRLFEMWEMVDPESARAYARQRAAMAPPKKKGPFVGPPSSGPMLPAPKPMKIV